MDVQKNLLHWFIDPITNHYADFEGRVNRQTYWMFILVWLLISIGLALLGIIIGEKTADMIHTAGTLVILVPSVALAARRLHDTGKSGWLQLIALIPIVGWVVIIVLLAQKGEAGENQYGPNPDGEMSAEQADAPTKAEIPPADASSAAAQEVESDTK